MSGGGDRWALFDLDGCLIDSSVAIPHCLNVALAASGRPQRRADDLRWAIGPPLASSIRLLLADGEQPAPDTAVEAALAAYRAAFDEVAASLTTVVEGIPALLDDLPQRRAIVTSKPFVAAAPLVEAMGLARSFEAVFAPGPDVEDESKAVTLGRALRDLAVDEPARATMVGDRHHDVAAGRHHGCRTIGVTWGAGDRAELVAARADDVVDHPDALRALLLASAVDARA